MGKNRITYLLKAKDKIGMWELINEDEVKNTFKQAIWTGINPHFAKEMKDTLKLPPVDYDGEDRMLDDLLEGRVDQRAAVHGAR